MAEQGVGVVGGGILGVAIAREVVADLVAHFGELRDVGRLLVQYRHVDPAA